MSQPRPPSPTIARLAADVAGDPGPDDPLARELADWMASAPGFQAFVERYRAKIRKKVRTATEGEARRDVRTELLAARLLLADRRLDLGFEPHGSGRRGPDFSATMRGARPIDIEVTRLRRDPGVDVVAAAVLGKLRQFPPGIPNLLLLAVDVERAGAVDVAAATRLIRTRADARDPAVLAAAGVDGSRAFYERYLRLGAILIWSEAAIGEERAAIWSNGSARIALPERVLRACVAAFRAGPSSSS